MYIIDLHLPSVHFRIQGIDKCFKALKSFRPLSLKCSDASLIFIQLRAVGICLNLLPMTAHVFFQKTVTTNWLLISLHSLYNIHKFSELQHKVLYNNLILYCVTVHDKWIPVTTIRPVFRLWMEERHSIWRVAANILNKQSLISDKVWSSGLGVVRGANNCSL